MVWYSMVSYSMELCGMVVISMYGYIGILITIIITIMKYIGLTLIIIMRYVWLSSVWIYSYVDYYYYYYYIVCWTYTHYCDEICMAMISKYGYIGILITVIVTIM